MKRVNLIVLLGVLCFSSFGLMAQVNFSELSSAEILYGVSVVGAVKNPGVYHVPPTTKLSEVVALANYIQDATADSLLAFYAKKPSTRNIKLTHKKEEIMIDLESFLLSGSAENNPYISDGDLIFVPNLTHKYTVFGAVNREGEIEFLEGDRLSTAINLSLGIKAEAQLEEIEILRYNNNHELELLNYNLAEALENPETDADPLLKADDRIYIRSIPNFHEQKNIMLAGEVTYPGAYPITNNTTTLYDVLVQADGPTDEADLANAVVIDLKKIGNNDPELIRLELTKPDMEAYFDYEYLKQTSRLTAGMFNVNIHKLWEEKDMTQNITLEDSLYVMIPVKYPTVKVIGQVTSPGIVKFEPNQTYSYYLELAGGATSTAKESKIRVIKANSNVWVKPNKKMIIEDGDTIFVPEHPVYDYWKLTREFITAAAGVGTLIIAIINIK